MKKKTPCCGNMCKQGCRRPLPTHVGICTSKSQQLLIDVGISMVFVDVILGLVFLIHECHKCHLWCLDHGEHAWTEKEKRKDFSFINFWGILHNIFEPTIRGHLLQQWFQEWPHKVISFYSTSHNKWKEVSTTKLQFNP